MERIWYTLIKEAKKKINAREIPPFLEYGNSSCALVTDANNVYTGISIHTGSTLTTTAEKSAIISMLNNGEKTIKKMVILNELEELIRPSTDCFDYLQEIGADIKDIEVILDYDNPVPTKIIDILPDWWGTYRNTK